MEAEQLIAYLTEGLDAESATAVKAALAKDAVKAKANALRAQADLDQIEQARATLARELEGEGPQKPGARAYQKWAQENGQKVQALAALEQKFIAKYGSIEAAQAALAGGPDPNPNPNPSASLSKDEILKLIEAQTDARIRDGYSPRWSSLLTGVGSIVQKHMFAGRKEPIDFKKVEELAAKYNGDLNLAYDEYDKPEREKERAAAEDARVEKRVQERMQQLGANQHFPAAADQTPGALSTGRAMDKFDRSAMEKELVNTYLSGEYPGERPASGSRGSGFFGAN